MVEHSRSFVKPARMPRIRESERFVVEMMAEFVTERTQRRAVRGDVLAQCRPDPHPNQLGLRVVATEQLGRPLFANSQRRGGKYPDTAVRDVVELRCKLQELCTGSAHFCNLVGFHRRLDGLSGVGQACLYWKIVCRDPIAFPEPSEVQRSRWGIG